MTDFKLEASIRDEKPKAVRREGFIPAIIYGNDYKNQNVKFEKVSFLRLFKEAGTSNLVEIIIDGHKPVKTLVREVQLDPIRSEILHVDLFKVNMKEKIQAEIPLEFIGDSAAVVNLEGSLITSKDSVEVECLPGDLVSEIQIDISVLDDFDKNIKVEDIKVPTGIEILDDPEEVVAFVQEPRSEEELEALETEVVEDISAVEVETKEGAVPAAEDEKADDTKKE